MPGLGGISFNARTSAVTVAVNRRVCLSVEGGRTDMTNSTSGNMDPRPAASNRSASSSTTKRTRLKPQIVSSPDTLMCSARRPGVAMTTCGRCDKASACSRMSAPPVTRTGLKDCAADNALNCSKICRASSRVGVSTTAYMPNADFCVSMSSVFSSQQTHDLQPTSVAWALRMLLFYLNQSDYHQYNLGP